MAKEQKETKPAEDAEIKVEAPAEIKADPDLVAAKIAAGLTKAQANAVALEQARHDAALAKK